MENASHLIIRGANKMQKTYQYLDVFNLENTIFKWFKDDIHLQYNFSTNTISTSNV